MFEQRETDDVFILKVGRMFEQRETDGVFILKDSKKLSSEMKICEICESAEHMRDVSIGQYFKTIHDVDDGFFWYDRSMQRVHITS